MTTTGTAIVTYIGAGTRPFTPTGTTRNRHCRCGGGGGGGARTQRHNDGSPHWQRDMSTQCCDISRYIDKSLQLLRRPTWTRSWALMPLLCISVHPDEALAFLACPMPTTGGSVGGWAATSVRMSESGGLTCTSRPTRGCCNGASHSPCAARYFGKARSCAYKTAVEQSATVTRSTRHEAAAATGRSRVQGTAVPETGLPEGEVLGSRVEGPYGGRRAADGVAAAPQPPERTRAPSHDKPCLAHGGYKRGSAARDKQQRRRRQQAAWRGPPSAAHSVCSGHLAAHLLDL